MAYEKYLEHKRKLEKEAARSDPERRKSIESTIGHLPEFYVHRYGKESVPEEERPIIKTSKLANTDIESWSGVFEVKGDTPEEREESRRFLERYKNGEIPETVDLSKYGYNP